MSFPFYRGQPEFTETQHRVASGLQDEVNLDTYTGADLYTDLDEIGFKTPMTESAVPNLIKSLRALNPEPTRATEYFNPLFSEQQSKMMAINLARYALTMEDIFTAHYAATYAGKIILGYPNKANPIKKQVQIMWNGWVNRIFEEIDL